MCIRDRNEAVEAVEGFGVDFELREFRRGLSAEAMASDVTGGR